MRNVLEQGRLFPDPKEEPVTGMSLCYAKQEVYWIWRGDEKELEEQQQAITKWLNTILMREVTLEITQENHGRITARWA